MFIILFTISVVLCYFYSLRQFNYFSKKHIKYDRPLPIFGNHLQVVFSKKTEDEMLNALYKKYPNEKVVGYYKGTKPIVVIRDLEIIKHVLSLNFLEFTDRSLQSNTKIDPLMRNIFTEVGDTWKITRNYLTPAFSSSKLKKMVALIVDCTHKLVNVAHNLALEEKEFDACNLSARFTIDVIGACGFGIDMKSMNNEHSLFLHLRDILFIKSKMRSLISGFYDLFPNIFPKRMRFKRSNVQQIIKKIFDSVCSQKTDDTRTDDFLDMMLKLRQIGKLSGDSMEVDENGKKKKVEIEFDEDRMLAQLYIFFVAGFETSSTVMGYAMHQLAYHPEIQIEVQQEIDEILAKNDNKLCYQSLSEMNLLEQVTKEALRLFPPGAALGRICTKDFVIPELNILIEAGTTVGIPVYGIQTDPQFFENPLKFNPKRFSHEASQNRHKYVFLPFGEGPRKCIGARFGTLIVMAGLAVVLEKFTIKSSPSSTINIKVNPASYVVQSIEGGLPVQLNLRKK
ncbi:probable cytochrome P450 6a18 [Pieris brassicae]|uniref:probable cytochrome P450 6a18 n=1 Tax=Pieris brassicae TaxID=7116 RepID=UPI001E65E7F4|nr:probable cytochrome P450 6a18 [Pieris brassicae]